VLITRGGRTLRMRHETQSQNWNAIIHEVREHLRTPDSVVRPYTSVVDPAGRTSNHFHFDDC